MLENLKPVTRERPSCRVRTLFEELEPEDSQHLRAYIDDLETWSAHGLHKALDAVGVSLAVSSILRHRSGGCSC